MAGMPETSPAELIRAFIFTHDPQDGTDAIADRPGLAAFLREHGLVSGPVPISPAHHEEAVALRDGLRAHILGGPAADAETIAHTQRILDGLRVTVTLETDPSRIFVPAVVDELRRALARIAAAWAAVVITGQWRDLRNPS